VAVAVALTPVVVIEELLSLEQTHPLATLVICGPLVQKLVEVKAGAVSVDEDHGFDVSHFASTRTGITAPVPRENSLCPRTRKRLRISPLCEVMDSQALASWAKMSSRTRLERESCAAEVSATTPDQKGSFSGNVGSKLKAGKRFSMYVLLLRRSQVWVEIPSRRSSLMVGTKGYSSGRARSEKVRFAVFRQRVKGEV
jgi:hypothetical protein